jgi:four helix bundle protein
MVFIREAELLAVEVHDLVTILRRKGEYNAANQLSSAVDSVYANVTEGYGRGITRDGLNYFRMGRASCDETEGHLRVNAGKRLLPAGGCETCIDHVIRVRYLILRYAAWLERRIKEKDA